MSVMNNVGIVLSIVCLSVGIAIGGLVNETSHRHKENVTDRYSHCVYEIMKSVENCKADLGDTETESEE